jgi:hypothetical protein
MLQQLNFYFIADTDSPLLHNILLHKKLRTMLATCGPKNFAKPQKILDFSVLVWYDA